jgi:tetratricopeptide (TPR) repeat protein
MRPEDMMLDSQPLPQTDQKALALFWRDSADNHRVEGRYDQAEPLYRRALSLAEQVYGPDHLEVSAILNNLAVLYKYTGDFEEAERLYQRALAITEQALGPEKHWPWRLAPAFTAKTPRTPSEDMLLALSACLAPWRLVQR